MMNKGIQKQYKVESFKVKILKKEIFEIKISAAKLKLLISNFQFRIL